MIWGYPLGNLDVHLGWLLGFTQQWNSPLAWGSWTWSRGWMIFGESKSQRCWHPHSMIQSTKTLSNTMGSGPPNSQSLSSTWTRGYIQTIPNRLPELPKINHRHQYVIRANHSTAKISRVPYRTTWKNMSLITPVVESNIWLWWQGAILLFWSALANIPSSVFPAML